ncbi:MAG TPA: hypothetical protein VF652_12510, partial [Allosphingosinicella sp.]
EFFRRELPHVFRPIFELADGAPDWDELNDQDTFFQASKHLNVKALGRSEDGREEQGWLFSYFPRTVREIEDALEGSGGRDEAQGPAGEDQPSGAQPPAGSVKTAFLQAAAAALTAAAGVLTAAAERSPQGRN